MSLGRHYWRDVVPLPIAGLQVVGAMVMLAPFALALAVLVAIFGK